MTITATGIEGVNLDTSFTLTVDRDCSQQIITPSVPVDQSYRVYDLAEFYEVDVFGNDEPIYCLL